MYTIAKVFLVTKQVELIEKKEFIRAAFNPKNEVFVVYITFFSQNLDVYPSRKTQIAFLKVNKAFISDLSKYANFADIFSKNLAVKLPKYIRNNNYAINWIKGKQLSYRLIYTLKSVEFEILKTYIKINLANSFLKRLKSLEGAHIFFIKKFNSSFQLCVNY